MRQTKYEYDAFISHAVEDKIPIANELCAKLESAGLRIWYSGKELGVGDSIEKTIEKGLHRSRYGIVILSPTYLAKNWTIREFYTLLAKEIEEQKVILPVLYNVTVDDLKNKDLLMADRFAVNADRGLDFVVSKLVSEIKKPKVTEPKTAWLSRIWVLLIASLLANLFFLLRSDMFSPQDQYRLSAEEATLPVQNQLAGHSLLDEMHRLAVSMNHCTCTQKNSQSSGPRHVRLTSNRPQSQTNGYEQQEDQHAHLAPGSKMTMAVVFQIETPQAATASMTHQDGELLESLEEKPDDAAWISLSEPAESSDDLPARCTLHATPLAH